MADLRAATDAVCFGQGGRRSRRADIGRNRVEAGCPGQHRSLAFPHHVVPTSVHRCRHRVRAHRERLSGQPATSRRRDGTALGRVRARDSEVRRMPHAAPLGCRTSDCRRPASARSSDRMGRVHHPRREGDVRNLTNSSGSAERDPAWSPDDKFVSYFSDKSAEYQRIHDAPAALESHRGAAEHRRLMDPMRRKHPSSEPAGIAP